MSVQSKSTNESTEATSTVDAGRLFHLGMVLGKKLCKHLFLNKGIDS